MARFNGNYIENPEAYERAKRLRIQANANTTRRRKLEAAVAGDSPDFRAWLFGIQPDHVVALGAVSQEEFDRGIEDGPAGSTYQQAWKEWCVKYGPRPEFLGNALCDWGGLTDNQLTFARKIFAERAARAEGREVAEAARKASAQPWVAGRQEIAGVVQSTRWQDNDFGGGSLKGLLLLADGRKIWTTIPARCQTDEQGGARRLVGETLTFRVTIELSKDDATMAFGKRPN